MITRRLALGSLAACFGCTPILAGPNDLIRYEQMASAFIEPRNVHVWLPPGYYTTTRRYPVIYMHDGQNAFSPAFAFRGQAWEIDAAMTVRSQSDQNKGAIVVGIWNTPKRRSDYAPTAIEALLPAPQRDKMNRESGQAPAGDAYLRFIVEELKLMIDTNFRTNRSRRSTAILGASRGGIISLYGLCEYPHIFGSAACLSTHWLLHSTPSPTNDPRSEIPNVHAALGSYLADKLPKPGSHKIWMDHGTINLDSFYAPYQQVVNTAFDVSGWIKGQNYQSRVYQGADHNEAAWRARLNDPLDFIDIQSRL
jgi:enterochelin esterase-like enzyme